MTPPRTRDDIDLHDYTGEEIAGFLAEDTLEEEAEEIHKRFTSAAA